MSEFLKKFKSVFVVEDETTGAAPKAEPQTSAPAVQQSAPAPAAPSAGAVSDKFVEILAAALEKNNPEGFDYFEFRQSLKNLAKMPMDEQTRYQSAYAMAQTLGATGAKLIESAKYYIGILGKEQDKFNEAHAQQRAKLIGNREEEIKNLEADTRQKAEQIKQLTQQIEANQARTEQIRKEISESTVKVETTKADFSATFSTVVGQIQEDIAKMQQYLK